VALAIRRCCIYLTPFVPLSFEGEGEGYKKRGALPLLNTSSCGYSVKGEGLVKLSLSW
jgi:hypothetical protein